MPVYSQIKIKEKPEIINSNFVEPEIEKTIYKYDSLQIDFRNLATNKNDKNAFEQFVGQKIVFKPRHSQSNELSQYYGCFFLQIPDTVWVKKPSSMKKVKPKHYKLLWRYKSEKITDKSIYKSLEYIPGKKGFSYSYLTRIKIKPTIYFHQKEFISSGYYTHFSNIEGKEFTIKSINKETGTYIEKYEYDETSARYGEIVYDNVVLETSDGKIIHWKVKDLSKETSIVILGYLEKIKQIYFNETYHVLKKGELKNKYNWSLLNYETNQQEVTEGKILPKEILFYGIKNSFLSPYITFVKNDNTVLGLKIPEYLNVNDKSDTIHNKFEANLTLNQLRLENEYRILQIKEALEIKILEAQKKEKEEKQKKQAEKEAKDLKLAEQKAKEDARLWNQALINEYGKKNAKLMQEGRVRIGWTKEMCSISWGAPIDVNRYTTALGVTEQWIYGLYDYLYFENGKLTFIQN